jgi:hypothetical protein
MLSSSVSREVCESHSVGLGVGVERRHGERRQGERRVTPGEATDVTRIEHENLATEIAEHGRLLRNIEHELQLVRERVNRLSNGLSVARAGVASDSR